MMKSVFLVSTVVGMAYATQEQAAILGNYVGEWGDGTLHANIGNYVSDANVVDASDDAITTSSGYRVYEAGVAGTIEWLDFLATDLEFLAFNVTSITSETDGEAVMTFSSQIKSLSTGKSTSEIGGQTLTVTFDSENKMITNTFNLGANNAAEINGIFTDDADGFDNTAAVGAFLGEWGAGTLQGNEGVYAADNVVVDASGAGGITASSNYKLYDAGIAGLTEWLVFLDTLVFDQFEVTLIEPSGANHAETVMHFNNQITVPATGKTAAPSSGHKLTIQFDEANKMSSLTFTWVDEAGLNDAFTPYPLCDQAALGAQLAALPQATIDACSVLIANSAADPAVDSTTAQSNTCFQLVPEDIATADDKGCFWDANANVTMYNQYRQATNYCNQTLAGEVLAGIPPANAAVCGEIIAARAQGNEDSEEQRAGCYSGIPIELGLDPVWDCYWDEASSAEDETVISIWRGINLCDQAVLLPQLAAEPASTQAACGVLIAAGEDPDAPNATEAQITACFGPISAEVGAADDKKCYWNENSEATMYNSWLSANPDYAETEAEDGEDGEDGESGASGLASAAVAVAAAAAAALL